MSISGVYWIGVGLRNQRWVLQAGEEADGEKPKGLFFVPSFVLGFVGPGR